MTPVHNSIPLSSRKTLQLTKEKRFLSTGFCPPFVHNLIHFHLTVFLQYTRFSWKFTVLFENFTVYKIQFYSIYFTVCKIQLKIPLYTRFNFYSIQDSIENSTLYKIQFYSIQDSIVNFTVYKIQFYIIQDSIENFTVYKIQFYSIQDSILQYTRFNPVRTLIINSNYQ